MYTPDDHVPQLEPFVDEQLWVAKAPQRFYGIPMGTRMTVARLPNGRLWVHSPIPLDVVGSKVKADLDALGDVAFAVAPNFIHHLYMAPFMEAYPNVRLWVSPKLETKRSDLPFEGVLDDEPPADTWGDTFDQAVCRGSTHMDEVVFFHKDSKTLVLCDLLECVHHTAPWGWRLVGKLAGIYERPAPPVDMRATFRDKPAARAFVDRVLDWDIQRIILSHGNLIDTDAKDTFARAYGFLH